MSLSPWRPVASKFQIKNLKINVLVKSKFPSPTLLPPKYITGQRKVGAVIWEDRINEFANKF